MAIQLDLILLLSLHDLCRVDELVKVSYLAPNAEALVAIQPELIGLLGLHGLCGVEELVKVSYWAPSAEAIGGAPD